MNYSRLNLIFVFIIALLLVVSRINSSTPRSKSKQILLSSPTIKPTNTPTPTPSPTPTPPFPVRLIIPRLTLDSNVEPVSNDAYGTMELPQEIGKVGWYYKGYKPGEKGNAVIGGHLDLTTGAPAIFYRLKNLTIGDIVKVVDAYGIQRTFIVGRIEQYAYNEIPIANIFGISDSAHLNLITCSGFFNQSMHNYSHRLVIYTNLLH